MIELRQLDVLEGPNIYYPQAGVAALLRMEPGADQRLALAIKTWAQSVGVVIGHLRLRPAGDGLSRFCFTCNAPAIGGEIVAQAVADLQAEDRGDSEWSHDDALFELRRRRMREDPGLPLLQLRAEAQGRGLPVLPLGDGRLQIGTGASGWRFDPAGLSVGLSVAPPWAEIGLAPAVLVGGPGAEPLAAAIAAGLAGDGLSIASAIPGDFDRLRAAQVDESAQAIVASVDLPSALARGVAIQRCLVAVVLPLAGLAPDEALAAGLPALLADAQGLTLLAGADPRALDLAGRTAAPVLRLPSAAPADPGRDPLIQRVAQIVQATLAG